MNREHLVRQLIVRDWQECACVSSHLGGPAAEPGRLVGDHHQVSVLPVFERQGLLMTGFDFTAAAALLCSPDNRAPSRHLRFEGAAEAIRHAIEQLSRESLRGSVLEVGEERYDAGLIQKLYASDDYPLARSHPKFRVPPHMWGTRRAS
jgi:hypothetical protein